MNPKDSYDTFLDAFEDALGDNAKELDRIQNEILKQKVKEGKRKTEAANRAYNDLCDALGVKDLNATIEGGATHLRIPVSSVATMVSRIEALKNSVIESEVLTEGVL